MKQAKVLSSNEFKRALAIANSGRHSLRNCLALQLSFLAGLRAKEIAALVIGDIFSVSGEVKTMVNLSAAQTKGKKGRVFAVNDKLAAALQAYYVEMGLGELKRTTPLLRSQKGCAITPNSMVSIIKTIFEDAGIESATSHSGRRSFLTGLADKGVGIHILKELAGHANIQTTARYLATSPTTLLNAANLL
ncbi:MAG: tyrosine-type recombinase/integrase [Alteromonadaceae bacterium]|nr:tyrosine-type recombinase/integrase [Alteromonadaceae bacterium]